MRIGYLEIVTPDVQHVCRMIEKSTGEKFDKPNPLLGNAYTVSTPDGGLVGVRAPMHDAEEPVTRTYFRTDKIEDATQAAINDGAELAHPVHELPGLCKFSIVFQGKNQFGFWQSLD